MIRPWTWDNPILSREIRTRMRGARAFWVLFAYTAVLAAILFITYLSWWNSVQGDLGGRAAGGAAQVGKLFYGVLFTVQAILVGIITPALTAGGISIEKEQRTFDLLMVSLMPRRSIVIGKLLSALAFVGLLLTASLPLISVSFLLGGVSPAEVLSAYGLLLVTAFLYGAVGIACSSVAKNTTTATVMTYGAILVIFFVTLPLSFIPFAEAMGGVGGPNQRVGLTALNPIGALTAGTATESYFGIVFPAWLTALVINGLFGIILTLVAVHRLDYPRTDRSGWLRLLTTLLVGMLAFCIYGIFLSTNSFLDVDVGFTVASFVTLLGLIPLISLFATADGVPEKGGVWSFIDPRRLARGEAPSGLLYVMLLILLCMGILLICVPRTAALNLTNGPVLLRDDLLIAFLVLALSTAWGFGSLGIFFSVLTRNRWSALGLVAASMLVIYLIPFIAFLSRSPASYTPNLLDNTLYLSPLTGVVDLTARTFYSISTGSRPSEWVAPILLLHDFPALFITSALYLLLGLLLLVVASVIERRRAER